ncbi:hypothetical protein [Mesorhizobium sp. SARCC-RB16n]|nr:hypothetical protein [Mesorhizobium sp. SARCC-RB16n]
MADESTPEVVTEVVAEEKAKAAPKAKAKEKRPANHELMISGNVVVTH